MACAVCLALSEWLAHGRWFFCITSGRKRAESGDKINGSSNGHPALVFSPFSPTGPSLAERWSNLPTLFHRILLSNSTRTLIHAGLGECPDGGITYLCVWCVCQHVCVCVCVRERERGSEREGERERERETWVYLFIFHTLLLGDSETLCRPSHINLLPRSCYNYKIFAVINIIEYTNAIVFYI